MAEACRMSDEQTQRLRAVLGELIAPLSADVQALRREVRELTATVESRVDAATDAAMRAEARSGMVADHMDALRDALVAEVAQASGESLRLRIRIEGHLSTVVREVTEERRSQSSRFEQLSNRVAILEAEAREAKGGR